MSPAGACALQVITGIKDGRGAIFASTGVLTYSTLHQQTGKTDAFTHDRGKIGALKENVVRIFFYLHFTFDTRNIKAMND